MRARGTGYQTLATALATTLCVGCGSTAIVTTRDGELIEGVIDAGGERTLILKTGGGARVRVQRAEITDIDHPGNVAATIGVLMTIYGAANAVLGTSQCTEKGAAFCIGVYTPLTVGITLAVYGLATHSTSAAAASRPSGGEPYSPGPRPPSSPPRDGDSPWRRTSLLYLGPAPIVTPTSVASGFSLAGQF